VIRPTLAAARWALSEVTIRHYPGSPDMSWAQDGAGTAFSEDHQSPQSVEPTTQSSQPPNSRRSSTLPTIARPTS
jgi:hypothetical protein